MQDFDTLDAPLSKLAEDAANDALRALLKVTNNHPTLASGSPHRRDLVRYIKRSVEKGEAAASLGIHIELTTGRVEFGFCSGDAKPQAARRFTLDFERNKFCYITEK